MERRFQIRVCRGPECGDRRGSKEIYDELKRAIAARGAEARIELTWQSCFGRCTQGVNVLVREVTPDGSVPLAARRPTALYNAFDRASVEALVRRLAEQS